MSLTGSVALITGASKGIGRATALRLARDGASIVLNYHSDKQAADDLVKQIGPDRALAVQADAGNVRDIEKLVDAAVHKFGKIDILVPNAGVLHNLDLEHTTEAAFEEAFGLNVRGPYFLCQKAVPHMPPGSRIILVSTSVCVNSMVTPTYLLYAATKGAIEQMTRVLAKDVGRKQILVNAIAPGPTGTELFYKGKSEQLLEMIRGWSPFHRIGEPEEMADMIAFLAGKDSTWVSGQVIRANGASMV